MRFLLLLVVVPSLVACVTVQVERRGADKEIGLHCDPGRATAYLDSGMREKVRLTFDRADHCTSDQQITWITESETQLAEPLRIIFGTLTALTVGVPLVAAVVAATPATSSASANRAIMEVAAPVVVLAVLGSGFAVYFASGAKIGEPQFLSQRVEVIKRSTPLIERPVVTGTFAIQNGTPFPVVNGAVELSLDEGLLVRDGELKLDGASVDLAGFEAGQRLGALPACKRALERDHSTQQRLDAALECNRSGWGFADQVIAQFSPPTAAP